MVDWVKQHVTCPFIIVRPEVVRNIHMRIDNGIDLLHRDGSAANAAPPPLPVMRGRKVAICYSTHETGLALIAEAKRVALCPADTVYVVHVFDEEPVVRTHANALSFFSSTSLCCLAVISLGAPSARPAEAAAAVAMQH